MGTVFLIHRCTFSLHRLGSQWWWDDRCEKMVTWLEESMPELGLYSHRDYDKVTGKVHWVEGRVTELEGVWARDMAQMLQRRD